MGIHNRVRRDGRPCSERDEVRVLMVLGRLDRRIGSRVDAFSESGWGGGGEAVSRRADPVVPFLLRFEGVLNGDGEACLAGC